MIIGIENDTSTWAAISGVFGIVGIMVSAVLYLTYKEYYKSYVLSTSLGVASTLCFLSLLFLALIPPHVDGLTLVGHFALCSEILLVIYTVLPMPLYACVGISTLYSFMFEFLTAYLYGSKDARQRFYTSKRIVQNDISGINNKTAEEERTLVLTHSSLKDPLNVAGLQNVIRNISDFTTAISTEAISRLHEDRDTMNMGPRYSETAQQLHGVLSGSNILMRLNSNVPSMINAINSVN